MKKMAAQPTSRSASGAGRDPKGAANRILLVSGVAAGERCGVWDYTGALAEALRGAGHDVTQMQANDWSIAGTIRIFCALWKWRGIVHVQHPSQPFQRRMAPYLMLLAAHRARRVVTFHEFSRKGPIGTLLARILIIAADRIVATEKHEAGAIRRFAPGRAGDVCILPIGSNIPVGNPATRTTDVAFFGLLRSDEMLPEFLDVVEALGKVKAEVIGQIAAADRDRARAPLARAAGLGVEVRLDAPAADVADALAATKVALLPYPDGISARRGTALAAMANGALVVTTPPAGGEHGYDDLCLSGNGVNELASRVREALDDFDATEGIRTRAKIHVEQRAWPIIARRHLSMYETIPARR